MKLSQIAAFAVALGLWAVPSFAQTGAIEGRVNDDQGLALPGVTTTAKNTATGFTRAATSDATGSFRIQALPVGTYEVKAELTGFSGRSRQVVVQIETTSTIDFKMAVAGQTEEVTVAAEAPLVDVKRVGRRRGRSPAPRSRTCRSTARQFANLAALGARRQPRLPHRPHQVHAVRAAGRRRQRPQHQLPDRRRRQQRRHRRRADCSSSRSTRSASSTSRRSASAPTPDAPTAARIKVVTKSGTNDFQRLASSSCSATRALNGLSHTEGRQQRCQGRLPPQPVRREPGRADRAGQDRTSSPPSSACSRTPRRRSTREGLYPGQGRLVSRCPIARTWRWPS